MTLRPSTADSTEIAGVIMLSPKNSAAPNMPSAASITAVRRPRAPRPPQQRDQRHDAALAVVVRAHHQRDVGQGDDDHHRPEDQRHDAVDVCVLDGYWMGIGGVEHRLEGVDRAGADVAEHDAQRGDDHARAQCLGTGRLLHTWDNTAVVFVAAVTDRAARPRCRRHLSARRALRRSGHRLRALVPAAAGTLTGEMMA